MKTQRVWIFLLIPPLALLAISYLIMAITYKTPFLLNVVVHSNGVLTLGQTILFYDHFCRELLLCILLGIFIVGFFFFYGNPTEVTGGNTKVGDEIKKVYVWVIGVLFVAFTIAVIILGMFKVGYKEIILDLAQYKTRAELTEWGSHWHFHFLSRIDLIASAALLVLIYRLINNRGAWRIQKSGIYILASVGLLYVLLTVLFGLNEKTFNDVRYLGHQMREIVTHIPVTVLLSLSVLIFWEKKFNAVSKKVRINHLKKYKHSFKHLFVLAILTFGVPIFLLIRLNGKNVLSHAEGNLNLWNSLAYHYFEHALDYVFVALLVSFLYLLILSKKYSAVVNQEVNQGTNFR